VERQARLDAIKVAEAEYEMAVAQEEREKQLEQECLDEDAARRAKLPKHPKDASVIWKPFMEKVVEHFEDTHKHQSDVHQ